jgi:hypothetical protein
MAANLTPSIRLPPDEFNRIADTGRADLVDALMMSLSRFASPSTSSPFSTTIVLFSLERVVVKSAADADRHAAAAATNTNANMLLDIARCPAPAQLGSITPTGRRPQSLANNFTEAHSPGRDVPQGWSGYFHGFKLHVIERLTRDGNTLRWEATVTIRRCCWSRGREGIERGAPGWHRGQRLAGRLLEHPIRPFETAAIIVSAMVGQSSPSNCPFLGSGGGTATLLGTSACVILHQRPIILSLTLHR